MRSSFGTLKTSSPPVWFLVLISIFEAGVLSAREVFVEGPPQLQGAINSAHGGDIVTLRKGDWKDVNLTITRGGSATSPVLIRAERPGETILGGDSSIEIKAPYVTIDGLFFTNGALTSKKPAVILFSSHHGIVQNTAVVDFNPPSFNSNYYWVYFNGDNNLVDRCYFKGKNNLEPLIGNSITASRHNSVTHCYFKNIPVADANGREDIRVWGPGKFEETTGNDGAFFNIEGNLFDHADGEGSEIISLKSDHNTVFNNTIVATRGCLNIRRGNFNTVKGNIILGQGLEGARGLRMSGEHNLVQGNYVSGCEYGIQVSCGEYIKSPLTGGYKADIKGQGKKVVVPTYPQNIDVTVSDNVTVGNSGFDLEVGGDYKKHWPQQQDVLIPEQCLFQNNRFVRPKGGDSVVGTIPETFGPLSRFHFKANRYVDNVLVGGKNAYLPASSGCKHQAMPAGWTEAQEMTAFKPLTQDDVGPDWIIALRKAGNLQAEDSDEGAAPEGGKKKKKNKQK